MRLWTRCGTRCAPGESSAPPSAVTAPTPSRMAPGLPSPRSGRPRGGRSWTSGLPSSSTARARPTSITSSWPSSPGASRAPASARSRAAAGWATPRGRAASLALARLLVRWRWPATALTHSTFGSWTRALAKPSGCPMPSATFTTTSRSGHSSEPRQPSWHRRTAYRAVQPPCSRHALGPRSTGSSTISLGCLGPRPLHIAATTPASRVSSTRT
mmetsp:Transcript_75580/g.208508  ORF Transcript_75580/g.208508 Transcript_75580/m.208508 type:complete len:214 (+) Transcript_75580:295-936(+)